METVSSLFDQYGVFAMIVVIFLEYACFPISSELILPFTGAVARTEQVSFFLLLPLSVLAGLLGTGLCYLAGYLGGDTVLTKISSRFPKQRRPLPPPVKNLPHTAHGQSASAESSPCAVPTSLLLRGR